MPKNVSVVKSAFRNTFFFLLLLLLTHALPLTAPSSVSARHARQKREVPATEASSSKHQQQMRLQGVAVRGRLLCGKSPLVDAKVKIVDLDPKPDRDDLLGEFRTNEQGQFLVSGATREESDIEVVLKVYHDCLDEQRPCQRRTIWQIPSKYYNNGTLVEWFDVGTINMEMIFPHEERDCRH